MSKFTPKFTMYHPNGKGTGSAVSFELHPARVNEDGYILLSVAPQKTIGDLRGNNPTYPTFDMDNLISFKLRFHELTKMLQVIRGETESIDDNRGLFHHGCGVITTIKFRHVVEGFGGYMLELYQNMRGHPNDDRHKFFFFSSAEALGICTAIENSFSLICFGVPEVCQCASTLN